MGPTLNVAVVRGDNRRGAVAQALALLADDLAGRVPDDVLVKPNLVSHRRQLPSTHADTLSAALDALFAAGAKRVTVAEGATDASAGFDRFGYRREAAGLPVRFLDLNREETRWGPLGLRALDDSPLQARLSATVAEAPFRVSLALAKSHVTAAVTLGLKNMLSSLHPDDRVMMHGSPGGGNGYQGWRKLAVEFLKGDHLAVNLLTRLMGRLKNAQAAVAGLAPGDPFTKLGPRELGFLRSVRAMNRNLVALTGAVRPHLSVVDGFVGMHREGPRHGTPIRLGTVVAGTDAVAVDAVAAAVMGFEPRSIGYLAGAAEAGLGTIDLDRINVLGDPIAAVRRRFVPHSNHRVERHWPRLEDANSRGPHFSASRERASR